MADPTFENLQLVGRRVPDFSIETDERGQKYSVPLPGTFEVGVQVGGTFLPLGTFKAGNLFNADGSHVKPAEAPAETSEAATEEPAPDSSPAG